MGPASPFGRPPAPRDALDALARRLAEWYRPEPAGRTSVRLQADDDDLPDVTLEFERERRLFSRTMQLVATASVAGVAGPAEDGVIDLRTRRLLRRGQLEWREPAPQGDDAALRFADAGVSRGAETMTNVRELTIAWSSADRRWTLRLVTLAGALIGTAPGSAIPIGLEPEDVDGLLAVLRAFVRGARDARSAD